MNYPTIEILMGFRLVHTCELSKPTEFGRQSSTDSGDVFTRQSLEDRYRIAIADKDCGGMSRRLALVTPLSATRVSVENLSASNLIDIEGRPPIQPLQVQEFDLPLTLLSFERRIEITPVASRNSAVMSMSQPTLPPGADSGSPYATIQGPFRLADKLNDEDNDQLLQWLSAVTRVLQSAVSSADFYDSAAKEMVDLIGLDSGRVLHLAADDDWSVVASFHRDASRSDGADWIPISRLLRLVTAEKRTSWTSPVGLTGATESSKNILVAVASPLLDQTGEVIGVLYGERRADGLSTNRSIGKLEAMLVETLARGVAAGRARVEQENAAATAQIRFEQFFTAELSRHLASNPDLLTRRDTEVTALFCDIRQFSAISERLGPEVTMEWLSDVMGAMAECAAEYDGTLVDYIGDELMVMWGAPAPQPDQATRACRAALQMARRLAEMDQKWRDQIGQPTQLGFGVNTGRARVGNVGFKRKFRYAPFGNTVNIASRVQGATKYLGATVIITEATQKQLDAQVLARRLCSVRLINILEPIALFELCVDDSPAMVKLCQEYEKALAHFEAEQMLPAIHVLSEILRTHVSDGPTQLLLSRAVNRLIHASAPFDPVFELPGK